MFGFSKEEKRAKTLKDLVKASNDLAKEKEAYIKTNEDNEELRALRINAFDLEDLKITSVFSDLLDQHNIPVLESTKQAWLMDKPLNSEGRLIDATYGFSVNHGIFIDCPSTYFKARRKHIREKNKHLKFYLVNAMLERQEVKELALAKSKLYRIGMDAISIPLADSIELLDFLDVIVEGKTIGYEGDLPSEYLQKLAELTKTNIIRIINEKNTNTHNRVAGNGFR